MVDELSERQRAILRLLIEQYVTTAHPVASDMLAAHPELGIGSASVRNALADLERAGYIMQPHTSAGRIPSDKGYRYFVEHLMGATALPQAERHTIDHQFHQVELNIEEWSHLAASLLSQLVRNAAVVTPPHSTVARLKHFQLLGLAPRRVMLVLVAHDGTLTQQLLTLEDDWDQERLSVLAAEGNRRFANLTPAELQAADLPPELHALVTQVRDVLAGMLARLGDPSGSRFYREGLGQLLEQPEFRETGRLKQMLNLLEGETVLLSIFPAVQAQEGVQVIIGDEHRSDQMRNCSVVVARYGLPENVTGVIGVIGPTRLPYGRAVSSVRYLSDLLTNMLDQVYGNDARNDA